MSRTNSPSVNLEKGISVHVRSADEVAAQYGACEPYQLHCSVRASAHPETKEDAMWTRAKLCRKLGLDPGEVEDGLWADTRTVCIFTIVVPANDNQAYRTMMEALRNISL